VQGQRPEPEAPRGFLSRLGCGLMKERKVFLACAIATAVAVVQMGSQEVFALWVLVEPAKGGFGYDAT